MPVQIVTSKQALMELRRYILRPSVRNTVYGLCAAVFVGGLVCLGLQSYKIAIGCFIAMVILLLDLRWISEHQITVTMNRIREFYHTDVLKGRMTFEKNKLRVYNFVTKGEFEFDYNIMVKFVETEHYYALFTHEYVGFIVDKSQFTGDGEKRFLACVKDRVPNLIK
jgi:hypothetical protein